MIINKLNYGLDLSEPAKYSGGVLVGDNIYCIPANSPHIMIINTVDDSATTIPYYAGSTDIPYQQWSSGVLAPNGKIYCAPSHSPYVLVIDTMDNSTYSIHIANDGISCQYSGAALGDDGKIYFSPLHSSAYCVIDPTNDSVTMTQYSFGISKFSNVVIWDSRLVFIPFNLMNVVTYPHSSSTNTFNKSTNITHNSLMGNYWSSAVGHGNTLYTVPYSHPLVAKIVGEKISYLPIDHDGPNDNKWWGGVLGSDDKIYMVPYTSNDILILDTLDDSIVLVDSTESGHNKWRGAIAHGDSVYFIPYMADTVMKLEIGI